MKLFRMGVHLRFRCVNIATLVVVVLLWQPLSATAQDKYIAQRASSTLQKVTSSTSAKRIGFQRYVFMNRLRTKFDIPFYSSSETSCTALFPVGEAHRIYVLLLNAYWPSGKAHNLILCYRCNRGLAALVYKFSFQANQNSDLSGPVKSLRDIIGVRNWKNIINITVKKDLSLDRDYVQYKYVLQLNTLEVVPLFTLEHGWPPSEFEEERYDLSIDPISRASLKPGEFYHKYGFPVSSAELGRI